MRDFFRRLAGRAAGRYRKMSIQMVISLSFTAVAVVGMLFMGGSLYLWMSGTASAMVEESSQKVLAQVNLNLDSYLRRMMRMSDAMYYRVIKNTDLATGSLQQGMDLLYEENRDALVSIALFDGQGRLVQATPLATLKEDCRPAEKGWFQAALNKMENLHFSAPHVQNLFGDPHYPLPLGGISEPVCPAHPGRRHRERRAAGGHELCGHRAGLPGRGAAQRRICLPHRRGRGAHLPSPAAADLRRSAQGKQPQAAAGYRDGSLVETFEGEQRQITVKTVGYTGWKLVGVAPAGPVAGGSGAMFPFGLSLLLFSAFLLAFLNFRISDDITDPIRRLEQSMRQMEAGREDVEIEEAGCYEVQRLGHAIRSMVSTMRHLMQDIIQQESQKRRSELEVLQSQINPHFLYNTLDSVIWMTEAGRYQEAIQMVTSLARLFRISLSRGKSIIPLQDELEHARHYMTIQEIRYKNRFSTRILAQNGTEGLYTLKLMVQPILENAIYHGMAACEDDGLILVTARREGGDVVIEVADNGTGMRPEVVAQLLDEDRAAPPGKGSGIGVRNVHRRIRLTFGEPYGLTIRSEPDEGTVVQIRLPALDADAAARLEKGEQLP